jgi:hypothetical protein
LKEPSALLELLENSGLVHGDQIDERRVLKLSAGQLSDLGAEAAAVTRPEDVRSAPGSLTHTSTLSLGGGTEPCVNLACRLRHIDQLVPFAALYSDRVYIHNFLSNLEHEPHSVYIPSLIERRYTLLDDLQVIERIRPLIEAGLIVPVTSTGEVCNQCIARGAFGTDADKRFKRERRRLAQRFFKEMSVSLEYSDGEWVIHCDAPPDLLEHGGMTISQEEPPEPISSRPRLLERALNGELVKLSADVRRQLGQHDDAAGTVLGSVLFEMAVSQVLGTSYLSDTKLPIDVLSAISGDADLARRNSLVQKHLTSLVPFLGDVPPEAVLKVRQRESEYFLAYRQALNSAIDDVRAQRTEFTERDARAIYSDVMAPGLAKLDRAVKDSKRDVIKETARSIGGWSAAITFGMYSGLLPAQLLLAAKALGLTKVVADIGITAGKLISAEDSIKKEELFFLWKVRQLAQKRR